MATYDLETFDTTTGATITSYPAEPGDDADDACAILRAELASYPEYLRLGETWGVREVAPVPFLPREQAAQRAQLLADTARAYAGHHSAGEWGSLAILASAVPFCETRDEHELIGATALRRAAYYEPRGPLGARLGRSYRELACVALRAAAGASS